MHLAFILNCHSVQEVEGNRILCFNPKSPCQSRFPDDAVKMVDEEDVVSIKFPDNCKYSFLMIEMCYKTYFIL